MSEESPCFVRDLRSPARLFGLAIGGIYQNGTGNPDAEIDFVAIYQGVTLTAEQAEEHYLAANITP